MFDAVPSQVSFSEEEAKWLAYWRDKRVFQRSVERNKDKVPFTFYEGPPTANGMPHPGHVLTRIVKDLFLRFRTMRGFHTPRRGGWDTHGLPVEVEVEKALGIHGRQEIEKYGVDAFTRECIRSVFRYVEEWRVLTDRIGFWVDLDDAYVTYHRRYVESVWWALAQLFNKGLLYQDYKVVWWWPQGGTALSAGEVGQGYRTVDDPSIVVRFARLDEERTSFLAWTTTPWTLPSNVGLAVAANESYITAQMEDGERLIMAEALAASILGKQEHRVVTRCTGAELVGARYRPIFDFAVPEGGKAYEVIAADFVTLDAGTGLVHLAPAFGEDDFRVARDNDLGFLQLIEPDGTFSEAAAPYAGTFCKDADRAIIRDLRARNVLFSEATYRHEYPFCWRADQDPLIQYARRSWFIRTTALNQLMLENNSKINWEPEHIKSGRFGEFLRGNVDWALSRERFWGTPLPIWVNDETGDFEAVGSVGEILERNPRAFEPFDAARAEEPAMEDDLRVHKPWIDQVTWSYPDKPGVYRRVPEVIDCWFDSGCMPFAQWGHPHVNSDKFERFFPADFITEGVDQTRGWFYSLLAISTLLFPDLPLPHPYRNCFVIGLISDEKGQKLSKSKKNYTDPLDLVDEHGADALRWSLFTSSVPGQTTRFYKGAVQDATREFLLKVWNVYSFFVTYARIDQWKPKENGQGGAKPTEMDRWILAELNRAVGDINHELEHFRSHTAARRLQTFVDALSNWYVRRSRARFWASATSEDKDAAFGTLHQVLITFAKLAAPFTPFLSETIFRNLSMHASPSDSVHLETFPRSEERLKDEGLRSQMNTVRTLVTLGQRVRATETIKVRQPLAEAIVVTASEEAAVAIKHFESAFREEVNVHQVTYTSEPARYVTFQLLPNFRSLGRRFGKKMPLLKRTLGAMDGESAYAALAGQGRLEVLLEGEQISLEAEDVEVRLSAKEGFSAASEGGYVVVLDTTITQELKRECYAREVINRIQRTRKELDLPFESRVEVTYEASGELAKAMERHQAAIAEETLCVAFDAGLSGAEEHIYESSVEGNSVRYTVKVHA